MSRFLIRDDDANATTDPRRLERAYAPLLDAGLPLTFSVIPRVGFDTLAPDGLPERFLQGDLAGSPRERPLLPTTPLAVWLRANASRCDVAQHGLDHRRVRGGTEFGALTRAEAHTRIEEGRALLARALGQSPNAFVAPWDALSPGALEAVLDRFPILSTSWLGRERLPIRWWPTHLLERLQKNEILHLGTGVVLRHRGGPIGPATSPEDVPRILEQLAYRADIAVVMLHHWMFWEQDEPHPVIRALARALARQRVLRLEEIAPPRVSRPGTAVVQNQDCGVAP